MKKLSRAILFDLLVAALIYLWHVRGIDSARVVLESYLWFIVAIHWIYVLLATKEDAFPRSPLMVAYDLVSTIVLVVVLAWLGMVFLPVMLFIGWIFVCAKLDRAKKAAA